MTTIADMAKRYRSINIDQLCADSIIETATELEDVNRQDLLSGYNALGFKITPKYKSKYYAEKKEARNALAGYGTPDLYDTGSFHEKIEFHIQGRVLVWQDSDIKTTDLLSRYGSVLGVFENDLMVKYRKLYLFPVISANLKLKTGMR